MDALLGIVRYEVLMGAKRWGVWLAMLFLAAPAMNNMSGAQLAEHSLWSSAATIAVLLNLMTPVVGGLAMADRLQRDDRLGVSELLRVTPLSRVQYVLGKYLGAVAGTLLPILAFSLAMDVAMVATGASAALLPAQLVAFLCVNVPTYLFVGAFSIACPAVMPLRVYQVLFTGYWFWGNFLTPKVVPTLAGTLLTPSGVFAASGLLSDGERLPWWPVLTAVEGIANIAVLLALAAIALVALNRYLGYQEARA